MSRKHRNRSQNRTQTQSAEDIRRSVAQGQRAMQSQMRAQMERQEQVAKMHHVQNIEATGRAVGAAIYSRMFDREYTHAVQAMIREAKEKGAQAVSRLDALERVDCKGIATVAKEATMEYLVAIGLLQASKESPETEEAPEDAPQPSDEPQAEASNDSSESSPGIVLPDGTFSQQSDAS